jgi:hypothetical protein
MQTSYRTAISVGHGSGSQLSGSEKWKGGGGWVFGDCGGGWDAGDGTGIAVLRILLILLAEFFLVYAIAIVFTYTLSLGETAPRKAIFQEG